MVGVLFTENITFAKIALNITEKNIFMRDSRRNVNVVKCCDIEVYIKTKQFLRPALAPLTPESALMDRLSEIIGNIHDNPELNA